MKNLFIFTILLLPCVVLGSKNTLSQKPVINNSLFQLGVLKWVETLAPELQLKISQYLVDGYVEVMTACNEKIIKSNTITLTPKNHNILPAMNPSNEIIALGNKNNKTEVNFYLTKTGKIIKEISLKKPFKYISFFSNYLCYIIYENDSSEEIDLSKDAKKKATSLMQSDLIGIGPKYQVRKIRKANINPILEPIKNLLQDHDSLLGGPKMYLSLEPSYLRNNLQVTPRIYDIEAIKSLMDYFPDKETIGNPRTAYLFSKINAFFKSKPQMPFVLVANNPLGKAFLSLHLILQKILIQHMNIKLIQ